MGTLALRPSRLVRPPDYTNPNINWTGCCPSPTEMTGFIFHTNEPKRCLLEIQAHATIPGNDLNEELQRSSNRGRKV